MAAHNVGSYIDFLRLSAQVNEIDDYEMLDLYASEGAESVATYIYDHYSVYLNSNSDVSVNYANAKIEYENLRLEIAMSLIPYSCLVPEGDHMTLNVNCRTYNGKNVEVDAEKLQRLQELREYTDKIAGDARSGVISQTRILIDAVKMSDNDKKEKTDD